VIEFIKNFCHFLKINVIYKFLEHLLKKGNAIKEIKKERKKYELLF